MGEERLPPTIEHYAFGTITIDGATYRNDVIVLPDRVVPEWWRERGHRLAPGDLACVADARPRVVVVGTGASGAMSVPADTVAWLESLGARVVVEPTAGAVETYGRLAPGGGVVACLHLTC
jgi:hypothetical protein